MLCYISSENAGSQEKMPLPKCRWRHFVLPAFSLAFILKTRARTLTAPIIAHADNNFISTAKLHHNSSG